MGEPFRTTKMVRFEHCDPAGLIFYPRYFQLSHQVVEDWFKDGLGVSHAELVVEARIGIPTVHLEATFYAASRLEDMLSYSLNVEKVGRSSVTLNIMAHLEDELRCQISQVIVFTQLDETQITSVPIPDDIRPKISQYLVST